MKPTRLLSDTPRGGGGHQGGCLRSILQIPAGIARSVTVAWQLRGAKR